MLAIHFSPRQVTYSDRQLRDGMSGNGIDVLRKTATSNTTVIGRQLERGAVEVGPTHACA
eukprot:351893-Chlamydomonas_euryale.AAC.34